MEEKIILSILARIERLTSLNRFVEARRVVRCEIENLQDITQDKCKAHKINAGFCKTCSNYNCKLNMKSRQE